MKKFIFAMLIISVVSCKAKQPWTKDALVNKCLGDFNKRNEKEKRFTGMEIPLICDCVAEKLVANYKSAAESDKDEAGSQQIGYDCAMEVMSK